MRIHTKDTRTDITRILMMTSSLLIRIRMGTEACINDCIEEGNMKVKGEVIGLLWWGEAARSYFKKILNLIYFFKTDKIEYKLKAVVSFSIFGSKVIK